MLTKLLTSFVLLGLVACSKSGNDKAAHSKQTLADAIPLVNARMYKGNLLGGRMTPDQVRAAKAKGVTTIIDLRRTSEPGVTAEAKLSKELGLRHVSIPVGGPQDLSEANARKLDAELKNAKGPVIVHCASGNRVGAMFAIRARFLKKQSAKEAMAVGKAAGLTHLEPAVRRIVSQ